MARKVIAVIMAALNLVLAVVCVGASGVMVGHGWGLTALAFLLCAVVFIGVAGLWFREVLRA